MSSPPDAAPVTSTSQRAVIIIAAGTVLALLYVGREVLIPVVLAFFLSLLLAPWVRALRHVGLGHGPSVLVTVLAFAVLGTGLMTVIGSQVVHMARGLPQYEATIRTKMQTARELTLGRLEAVQGEFGKVISASVNPPAGQPSTSAVKPSGNVTESAGAEALHGSSAPMEVMTRVLSSAWIPLETAGIVLVVLVFVLLEHESLRDRFIRLTGGSDLRATTAAINDAGTRLQRFFVSTFAVNFGVGVAIWLGLWLLGVPGAPLWGALTAVLRFVPYVGVWLVAVLAALFAAAVTPGWSMLVTTVVLYLVVELVVSQLIEPFLYGHTTGLSPLAVVVAAIFWSWLWGPVGLVMSTPLTLCLVVAGRHVKALDLLNVLLGDTPALSMPQRLYQRALSGDSSEILAEARAFLKRKSFAAYCDGVLLPALQLARIDLAQGAIGPDQQATVRKVIVTVVDALGSDARRWTFRRARPSVLDDADIGQRLRNQREDLAGRWQGPLTVAPGSVVLCVSLGSVIDDLATELLTRILRELHIDARHIGTADIDAFDAEPHPELTPNAVAMIYIVSADPTQAHAGCESLAARLHQREPEARIVALLLREPLAAQAAHASGGPDVHEVVHSLEEAAVHAIARFPGEGAGKAAT